MTHILTPRRPDSLSVEHSIGRAGCPEAIAQWATFGQREDNYFQQIHSSEKGISERSAGWDQGGRDAES